MKMILRKMDFGYLLLLSALIMQFMACGGPIPQGEHIGSGGAVDSSQKGLLILSGTVSGPDATPIPGVQVVAAESESGSIVATAVTDSAGRFKLNLLSGTYKITANLPGFSQSSYEVTLLPSMSAELTMTMGDQIPVGERIPLGEAIQPPSTLPAEPKPLVVERAFTDDAALHAWLNELASQQKFVSAIIPLQDETSLFCILPGMGVTYSVIPVDRNPDAAGIQARIDLNPNMKLIGVHCTSGKYLIVLGQGN